MPFRTSIPSAALLAVALYSGASLAAAPKFLEVGKSYSISMLAGTRVAKIVELDKESGWAKVQIDKPRPETLWINLAQVIAVNETLPASEEPLPPVSFEKL